ncbi:transposase [Gordonia sp. NPDC003424]
MARDYRPVDRDQVFMLPPDMRDWVQPSDPVWLVISMVDRLDTSSLHAQRRVGGVGRRGYDPDMLLTLLIWAWAHGQRSSRQIERLCRRDLTYRVICAGDVPDHSTISTFRKDASAVMATLFAETLAACARLGMGRLGVVALDGVKIASNASPAANRTEKHLAKLQATELDRLRTQLEDVAVQADIEHAANDADGDRGSGDEEVPKELLELAGAQRLARITEALVSAREHNRAAQEAMPEKTRAEINRDHLLARRQKDAEAAQRWLTDCEQAAGHYGGRIAAVPIQIRVQVAEQRLAHARAEYQAMLDARPSRMRGRSPAPVERSDKVVAARTALDKAVAAHARWTATQRAEDEKITAQLAAAAARTDKPHRASVDTSRNITDPQSRPMPLRGGGWVQGYNCQAVNSSDGLIIATMVGDNPVDTPQFRPMMDKAVAAAEYIERHRPVDSAPTGGIGVLLADAGYHSADNITAPGPDRLIATAQAHKLRKAHAEQSANTESTPPPPADDNPTAVMTARLLTDDGHALYSQRSHIAETPFGHAKHNLGFRRFTSCGLARAEAEFAFHAIVHNLFKAITHTQTASA